MCCKQAPYAPVGACNSADAAAAAAGLVRIERMVVCRRFCIEFWRLQCAFVLLPELTMP